MIINVKGKDVTLKYSFRAMLMYENIKNETFSPKTLTDVLIFMLCVIVSSDRSIQLNFDDLLDMVDDNPKLIEDFSDWLTAEVTKQGFLAQDKEVVVEDEKKTKLS